MLYTFHVHQNISRTSCMDDETFTFFINLAQRVNFLDLKDAAAFVSTVTEC